MFIGFSRVILSDHKKNADRKRPSGPDGFSCAFIIARWKKKKAACMGIIYSPNLAGQRRKSFFSGRFVETKTPIFYCARQKKNAPRRFLSGFSDDGGALLRGLERWL